MTTLPANVKEDLDNGFIMTDEDDGYQRCKKLSDTTYMYRCDIDGDVEEATIDVSAIDQGSAIDGFYNSVEQLVAENGQPDANMLIAECYFEHSLQNGGAFL